MRCKNSLRPGAPPSRPKPLTRGPSRSGTGAWAPPPSRPPTGGSSPSAWPASSSSRLRRTIYLGAQPKAIPHFVEVDKLGQPNYLGPLDRNALRDFTPTDGLAPLPPDPLHHRHAGDLLRRRRSSSATGSTPTSSSPPTPPTSSTRTCRSTTPSTSSRSRSASASRSTPSSRSPRRPGRSTGPRPPGTSTATRPAPTVVARDLPHPAPRARERRRSSRSIRSGSSSTNCTGHAFQPSPTEGPRP